MELPLRIILDEQFAPPELPLLPAYFQPVRSWGCSWQLDAMVSASVARPQSLTLVTGI